MNSVQFRALLAACLATLFAPVSAYAYLDPASGSILLQVVLGGIAGSAVVLKLFWGRLRALFGSRKPAEPPDDHSAV